MMHEFGHVMHYQSVSNSFWLSIVVQEINNGAPVVGITPGNPYGIPTSPANDQIHLAESWAEFIGMTYTDRRYPIGNTSMPIPSFSYSFNMLENRQGFPNSYPYDCGMLMYDLTDQGETVTGIVDEVSGFTIQEINSTLSSSVTSVNLFHQKINNLPQASTQIPLINNLFTSYGL